MYNLLAIVHEPTAHVGDPKPPVTPPVTAESLDAQTAAILKRLSRKPIDPTPEHELMADLGYDSLLVLELVGELEDQFNIVVPLNNLTHIRTVSHIVAEVRRLIAEQRPLA